MQPGETIGTEELARLTWGDAACWLFATALVLSLGAAGGRLARDWSPPPGDASIAEPAILLELEPMPEPEPAPEIVPPPPEPAPEAEPPPPEPEPVPPIPVPEIPPPAMEEPQVQPEIAEPLPEPESEPEPELPPEPVPEPEPLPEAEATAVALPMPATMSAELRQQRLDAPATNPQRPRQPPPERPRSQPPASSPPPQATPPSQPAASGGPTPQQWQQQVLRHLDRHKTYPRAAQRAGEEGVAQIRFTIDASGRVLSVSLAASSGIAALDQAAIETARRASPVPRPPASAGQGTISLTAAIRFSLR